MVDRMSPFLLGCLLLLGGWLAALVALMVRNNPRALRCFWWSSCTCSVLGLLEALLVPETWWPASVLVVRRWDLESFLLCFAAGGIAVVLPRFSDVRRVFMAGRHVTPALRLPLGQPASSVERPRPRVRSDPRLEDSAASGRGSVLVPTLLITALGALVISRLGLAIIHEIALTCALAALAYVWQTPKLGWELVRGAVAFSCIHAVIANVVLALYPDFYWTSWNFPQVTGRWWLGTPLAAHLLPAAFGMLWVPLCGEFRRAPTLPAMRIPRVVSRVLRDLSSRRSWRGAEALLSDALPCSGPLDFARRHGSSPLDGPGPGPGETRTVRREARCTMHEFA